MELIGYENSQLTELFLATRTDGQLHLPSAVLAFVERYKFAGHPTSVEEISGDKVSFQHGLFNGTAISRFDVYGDGVVVGSKSPTELLEAFVKNVSIWMESEFGLRRIETHKINRIFESHLVVKSHAPLLKPLGALQEISELVATELKNSTGLDAQFQPMGFGFAPDNTLIAGMRPISFRVERRAGAPFETNFYYSSAPLPTKAHLSILEKLEKLSIREKR